MYYPDRRAEAVTDAMRRGIIFCRMWKKKSLRLLSAHYKKLVLVLNCGSVIDLSILDQVSD